MSIRKLRAGRVPTVTASQYVGDYGTIFWNEATGALRVSDGATPGGNPLQLIASDFDFQFGDFVATTLEDGHASLSSVNLNQTIDIRSNGTGEVHVIGGLSVFDSSGDESEPVFRVLPDGQIRMLVPLADSTAGALEIIGNSTGVAHPPNQTGIILHITGNDGLVSRSYFDASNNYALLVGRRYNGTAVDTTKVLSGELMLRIAGQASNDTGFETFGPAQIDWVATEDQTPTSQGGEIRVRATPNGSSALAGIIQVASFNATNGVTATKFNGPITGLRTHPTRNAGNVTGTTLVVNFASDDIVHCTFTDAFTVDFSNHTIGRVITVIATNASPTGSDIITTGISSVNIQGDNTLSVSPQTTAIITYYCTTGLDTGVFASAVYA